MKQNKLSRPSLTCQHRVKSVQIRSFFWFVFSRIRTEYGEIQSIYLHIQSECGKITTRKNSVFELFSRSTISLNLALDIVYHEMLLWLQQLLWWLILDHFNLPFERYIYRFFIYWICINKIRFYERFVHNFFNLYKQRQAEIGKKSNKY